MHASKYGAYLSACCVYASMSGKLPLDLPDDRLTEKDCISGSVAPDADPEIIRRLQECARDCYRRLQDERDLYHVRGLLNREKRVLRTRPHASASVAARIPAPEANS
jgi:hypothetical protein